MTCNLFSKANNDDTKCFCANFAEGLCPYFTVGNYQFEHVGSGRSMRLSERMLSQN